MLSDSARWWEKYSKKNFQKYWDVFIKTDFQEIIKLVCIIFINCEISENAEKIMNKIQTFVLKYL